MNTKKYNSDAAEELMNFFIPTEVPNYSLPDPALLRKYMDMKERIWWITGEIEYAEMVECVRFIQAINREDTAANIPAEERKPIRIFLFSNGGDLIATLMMIDAIKASTTPIYTINMGEALSGACIILMCGHKRFALKHSRSLIHSGSSGIQGDYEKMEAAMDDYKALIAELKNIVLENTTIPVSVYSKKRSKDWYQYADDQIKYGIVDKIIESLDEVK